MSFVNLFQLLGIEDPAEWTIEGGERAWFNLTLAARNTDSTAHKTQQDAYRYLRDDSPDARKLVEELTGQPEVPRQRTHATRQNTAQVQLQILTQLKHRSYF